MDRTDHPIARQKDDALRGASSRDWRNLAKNVDPNSPQPGAGRTRRAQDLSSRSPESRIFAKQTRSDLDRAVARALSLVGETSRRITGQSRPSESKTRRRRKLIDRSYNYSEFSSKLIFTS